MKQATTPAACRCAPPCGDSPDGCALSGLDGDQEPHTALQPGWIPGGAWVMSPAVCDWAATPTPWTVEVLSDRRRFLLWMGGAQITVHRTAEGAVAEARRLRLTPLHSWEAGCPAWFPHRRR